MKTYFAADVGLNHNGSFKRAYDAILQAKQCGFDAVKFQVYEPDRLTANEELRNKLREGQFNLDWLPDIRQACDSMQIDLAITPFYPEAVYIISPYVDYIKIGSYEVGYESLIEEIRESGSPVVFSTGMLENQKELQDVINSIYQVNTILYCVSKYPCCADDVDFKYMKKIKRLYDYHPNINIGYSDHSHNPNVVWSALIAGAYHIEMHFDTDGKGLEYPDGHVWLAKECFELIHNVREAEKCFDPTSFVPDYSKRTDRNGRRP